MINLNTYIIEKLHLNKKLKSNGLSFPIDLKILFDKKHNKLNTKVDSELNQENIYKYCSGYFGLDLTGVEIKFDSKNGNDSIYSFNIPNKEQLNNILIFVIIFNDYYDWDWSTNYATNDVYINKSLEDIIYNFNIIESYFNDDCKNNKDFLKKLKKSIEDSLPF